jgi:RimJ/RimL family protein N-acetyltransferase
LRVPGILWSVRPAIADDAAVLTDIVVAAMKAQQRWLISTADDETRWRRSFTRWTLQSLHSGSSDEALSVIEVDRQPVGRLRIVRHPPTNGMCGSIELAGIQLRPAVQGQGIGSAVVRTLQREARDRCVPLRIGVEKDNPRARALYERLGCVLIGETKDEYLLEWNTDL